MDKQTSKFVETILEWWKSNKRLFPWRNTSDPYFILVTEILLRKTTSKQVNSIYAEFFREYPTVEALFIADNEKLKNLISSLGLSNQRTDQLSKLSKVIIDEHEGRVPSEYSQLLDLPGVGRYVAGAVMCQSYNEDKAMVDTNVIRVIVRYFDFKSDKSDPSTDSRLWDFVKYLIPKGKCKELNLGIIDFASSICLPIKPKCSIGPLNGYCEFKRKTIK
jgi:A/G-specific adenine glycosylase